MRHVAAYALLLLGGNDAPNAKDIKKVLEKAGVEANDEDLDKFLASVEGKNAFDLIKEGKEKLNNLAAVAVVATGAATGGATAVAEKKKETSEEAEADMGGLFGDDEDDY